MQENPATRLKGIHQGEFFMGLSLKQLAEQCIRAETAYCLEKKAGDPAFNLTVDGERPKGKIKLLSGLRGKDLYGRYLRYVSVKNKTVVRVGCADIRDFFSQIGFSPESLAEKTHESSVGLH